MTIQQVFEIVGGPGGTRTPNQAVMSGGHTFTNIDISSVSQSFPQANSLFVPVYLSRNCPGFSFVLFGPSA